MPQTDKECNEKRKEILKKYILYMKTVGKNVWNVKYKEKWKWKSDKQKWDWTKGTRKMRKQCGPTLCYIHLLKLLRSTGKLLSLAESIFQLKYVLAAIS